MTVMSDHNNVNLTNNIDSFNKPININNSDKSSNNFNYSMWDESRDCAVKYLKKTFSPLSSSAPVVYAVDISRKLISLANYYKPEPVLPVFCRHLEGAAELLEVTAFINIAMIFLPSVSSDNLDEEELKNSIDLSDLTPGDISKEKWTKRVVKQVKTSMDKTYSQRKVREEVAASLVKKGLNPDFAHKIAESMHLTKKQKPLIEKIYLSCFVVPGLSTVLNNLDKWKFIDLAWYAGKIGNIPLIGFVASIGLRPIALGFALTGLTLKLGHCGYKLYHAQVKVWKADKNAEDYAKVVEERTKEIWATAATGLTITGIVVPLMVSINVPGLILFGVITKVVGCIKDNR